MSSMMPDSLSALAGGGGPGGPGPAPAGPPPTIDLPKDDPNESDASTPEDAVRDAIGDLQKAMEMEQDDQLLAQLADLVAKAQKLLAGIQKEQDGAMGVGGPAKVARRANALGGGGGA